MPENDVHELDGEALELVAGGIGVAIDGNGAAADRGFGLDPNG